MGPGAVTFVTRKTVLRIFFVIFAHDFITGHFGYDRRGSDREAFAVALYDALDGALRRKLHLTVDNYIIRGNFEVGYGHLHGLKRGFVNIDFVYHLLVDNAYADDRILAYFAKSMLPLFLRKLLGIVYFTLEIKRLQDYSACDDWSGKRTPASLIDAGNKLTSGLT